jgi:hypothetical protein
MWVALAAAAIVSPRFLRIVSNLEAETLAEQYREAAAGRFPKGTRVKVLVRNEKGKAVLDFKGIPCEQVSQLVAMLTGELPPVREVRLMERAPVG